MMFYLTCVRKGELKLYVYMKGKELLNISKYYANNIYISIVFGIYKIVFTMLCRLCII